MPDETPVDELYQDFKDLIDAIDPMDVSLRETVRVNFGKSLLVAASSYFEERIKTQLLDFMRGRAANDELVIEFVRNKAVERQYHTYFNWSEVRLGSVNGFFGLFGNNFKEHMVQQVHDDGEYANAVRAFLHIGNQRNLLVHQNYAQFSLDSTPEEIYASYKVALQFVDSIGSHLARVSADIARRSAPDSS